MPNKPPRREWGSGSITWITPTKAKLRIRHGDGSRRSRTIRTVNKNQGGRSEAKKALEAFEAEVASSALVQPVDPATWTLRELMDAYVTDRARVGKARSTLESYRMVAKRLNNELAVTPIDQVTPDDFDRLYGELASNGLGANSIRQTHAVLSAAMNWAEKKGKVPTNPVRRATPPDRKRSERARIDPDDANTMIKAAFLPKEQRGEGNLTLAVAIFLATYRGLTPRRTVRAAMV